jgi:peptidoglycan/xylan/chitin deacetylase (PgdA/CDA1 family)
MKHHILNNSFFIVLLISFVVASGPVKTVPWNGHKGAVSFTFDDGVANQITNVMPALKTRGIHGTFYLIGNWNNNNPSPWIQASRDGNEIGNHTRSFDGLTQMNSASITTAIVDEAKYSRNQDTSIECVTLAYPGCGRNDVVDAVATKENFIGRTCSFGDFGDAHFYWNKAPANWMSMCAAYIDGLSGFQNAGKRIDEAAGKNTWFSTLVHGVGDANIPTESVTAMFDKAIKDSLWIETYQRVASYWRASFTMDTVNAVPDGSGWKLIWKSPHPKMPKSVPLLVTLDKSFFGNTVFVYQNGKEISPLANGSYPVEFMNMQLTVTTKDNTSISKPRISFGTAKMYTIEDASRGFFINIQGFNEETAVTIYDLKGASVYKNICSTNKIIVPELNKGVYAVKLMQGNTRLVGNFLVK